LPRQLPLQRGRSAKGGCEAADRLIFQHKLCCASPRGPNIADKSPAISLPHSLIDRSALSKACLPTPELKLSALDADVQHAVDSLEEWLISSVSSGKGRRQLTSVSLAPCVQGLVRGSSFLAVQQMAADKRENLCICELIREGHCMLQEHAQAEEEEVTGWK
jgi:hypothetical protein